MPKSDHMRTQSMLQFLRRAVRGKADKRISDVLFATLKVANAIGPVVLVATRDSRHASRAESLVLLDICLPDGAMIHTVADLERT